MDKKYHRSLLANIYLVAELYHGAKLGSLFDHLCQVLTKEIHCCAPKNDETDCYKSENSLFNKIYKSNQMHQYKLYADKNKKNNAILYANSTTDQFDIALIADVYFLNLLLYDVPDSLIDCIKTTIRSVHGYVLTDECIKTITKSSSMVFYKNYLKTIRFKNMLKKRIDNPGFLANINLYQKLSDNYGNHDTLEAVRNTICQIYNIELTPELIQLIANSKLMETYIANLMLLDK